MEHLTNIKEFSIRTGIEDINKIAQLTNYAETIFSENKKFNLTGHKSLTDITNNLIIGSLEPVKNLNVPRGTLFADFGTGAGIPGIPLAIKYDECNGILFDSNQKKIRFINKYCTSSKISNVKGTDIRVEDAGRMDDFRGKFDIIFTRAMSDIYTIAELGAPLLKIGGYIFLYVNKDQTVFNDYLSEHLLNLGLTEDITGVSDYIKKANLTEGVLLTKTKETDIHFPRRMPVIKRMALKCTEQ